MKSLRKIGILTTFRTWTKSSIEPLKKDLLGKVSQSGNVSFKGDREQDIRSFEEKRKDELRRLGKL